MSIRHEGLPLIQACLKSKLVLLQMMQMKSFASIRENTVAGNWNGWGVAVNAPWICNRNYWCQIILKEQQSVSHKKGNKILQHVKGVKNPAVVFLSVALTPSQTSRRFVSDTATETSLTGMRHYILKRFESSSCFYDLLHSHTKTNHNIVKPKTCSSSDFKHVQFKIERNRTQELSCITPHITIQLIMFLSGSVDIKFGMCSPRVHRVKAICLHCLSNSLGAAPQGFTPLAGVTLPRQFSHQEARYILIREGKGSTLCLTSILPTFAVFVICSSTCALWRGLSNCGAPVLFAYVFFNPRSWDTWGCNEAKAINCYRLTQIPIDLQPSKVKLQCELTSKQTIIFVLKAAIINT